MRSIEHVKRYTTNGMATDQGKMSNVNGLMIASDALGKAPPVGLTTFRPPYSPSPSAPSPATTRTRPFDVTASTPIDPGPGERRRVRAGRPSGAAPGTSPKPGEDMHAAVSRECRGARASVGIFDASTLGKIEVVGPDAVTFMERMYTNPWAKLGVGRCRYGLLLGEDGFIRDDGVIGRLAPTASTSPPPPPRRRPRAQHDGGLSSDRVAGPEGLAHLHHRAVGDDRAPGPERPQAPSPLRRSRRRPIGRGLPAWR